MMDINEIRHSNVRLLIRRFEKAAGKSGDRAGGMTMLATRLGKSSGQATHFAGEHPTKNIGDKIAREIEAKLGLERGWMDWLHDDDGAVQSHSQPMRLEPLMIAETHRALREMYEEEGRVFRIEEDPARFVRVYELRASLSEHPTQDEWVQFGRKLAAIMAPLGAAKDGRSDGVPTEGTDQEGVAQRVQSKA